ncbi:MAG: hypothetical protein ACM32H_08755, partial [Candidatus Aminicenantes bacterium RBG_16_66_30]
ITQSGKEIRLPWPRFAVDLDEVKPTKNWASRIATAVGAVIMLAVTDFAAYLFAKHQTIFFVNLDWPDPRPLFTPGAGRRLSLIVIAGFAVATLTLLVKLLTRSRWVDVINGVVSLGLIGLILTQSFDNLFAVRIAENILPKIRFAAKFTLLFIAVVTAVDLIKNIVIISRHKLNSVTHN